MEQGSEWLRRCTVRHFPLSIRIGATKQMIDLVQTWWRIFDETKVITILSGFILDRDWSKVIRIILIISMLSKLV
jgi:hypothetical protein